MKVLISWGGHKIETRPFDIPWLVLDSRRGGEPWNWQPEIPLESTLREIAGHAETHPEWLEICAP